MKTFRMHRGWREPNGLVTDHATLERVIKATSAFDAMGSALAEGDFLLDDDTNLGLRLNQHQKAMMAARARAEAKLRASLS